MARQRSPEHTAWLERAQSVWSERVDWWDEMSERNAQATDRLPDLERTIARLDLPPGGMIFDAGCGSGQFAIAYAQMGYVVTAADLVPEMIERARAHAAECGVDVTWRTGDLSATILPGERYNAIHARMTLQFVPDVVHTLNRFQRALKPGGRLYTSVPGACSPIYESRWHRFLGETSDSMSYLTPWDLERLLAHFGWEIVDEWPGGLPDDFDNGAWSYQHDRDDLTALRTRQSLAFTWAIVSRRAGSRQQRGSLTADR